MLDGSGEGEGGAGGAGGPVPARWRGEVPGVEDSVGLHPDIS